jgi:HlyD family secretion protein
MKMRKIFMIGGAVLLMVSASLFGLEVARGSNVTDRQLVQVVRGDLKITVSGNGNIQPSDDVTLTFGTSGRVDKVDVEEGDRVRQGDILAKLDTDYLELALTQAEVALNGQQVAVTQADVDVTEAKLALKMAEQRYDQLFDRPDIDMAEANVDDAHDYLEYVAKNLSNAEEPQAVAMWQGAFGYAQARLEAAEARLNTVDRWFDFDEEKEIRKMEVSLAEESLELARQMHEQSEYSLRQFKQALKQAEKDLSEAAITAPFDGVIAGVHVKKGDMIPFPNLAAAPVIRLVSYERMELLVEIDEMDIPYLKAGQEVTIVADPLPELEFAGEISTIFPVPREIGGVVVYDVKIKFDVPDDSGIRVGMNATAFTTSSMRSDVLLIPNRAIKGDKRGDPMVEVMAGDQIQKRPVALGASNGLETEVLSGLDEGDIIAAQ